MKKGSSASSDLMSGQGKVQKKGERMKLTVFGTAGQIIGTLEMRPRIFRSKKRGFWTTAKIIDWKAKKQFQFNAYAVEISSDSKSINEPSSDSENDPDKQQSLL